MTYDLTWLYPLAVPIVLGLLSWGMKELSTYLAEKTHFSRVSRIAMGISTIAGNVQREMQINPVASPEMLRTLQARAIVDGTKYLQTRYGETLKSLGGVDPSTLATMIAGAIGNQVAPAAAPASVERPLIADAAVSTHTPDPEPVTPLTEAVAPADMPFGPRADAA